MFIHRTRGERRPHQVTLVEQEDQVLVPEVLADVALEVVAAGAHRVPGVEHLGGGGGDRQGGGQMGKHTGRCSGHGHCMSEQLECRDG